MASNKLKAESIPNKKRTAKNIKFQKVATSILDITVG